MFSKRCWLLVTSANKKFIISNAVRYGHTQSNVKTKTSSKFTFSQGVSLVDKRYYEIERVVKIQTNVNYAQEPIFWFPGYGGRLKCVLPLAENVTRTSFCLQYPFEGSPICTSETAEILLPHLESCIDPAQKVNIVAHSFGGLIALDVTKLLESKGRSVRLCLMDSSPYALKMFGLNAFGDVYSAEFEANMIVMLLNSLHVKEIHQFSNVIESSLTFAEKVEILSPMLSKFCSLNCAEIKIFCLGLFNLTRSMLVYDENFAKFKCQAALIRPDIRIWEFPDDYKISNYFEKPASTYFTDGHHISMLKSKNTAALINQIFADFK